MNTGPILAVFDAMTSCPGCQVETRLVTDGARAWAGGMTEAADIDRVGSQVRVTCGEPVATCGLASCRHPMHNQRCLEVITYDLGEQRADSTAGTWGGWRSATDEDGQGALLVLDQYGHGLREGAV